MTLSANHITGIHGMVQFLSDEQVTRLRSIVPAIMGLVDVKDFKVSAYEDSTESRLRAYLGEPNPAAETQIEITIPDADYVLLCRAGALCVSKTTTASEFTPERISALGEVAAALNALPDPRVVVLVHDAYQHMRSETHTLNGVTIVTRAGALSYHFNDDAAFQALLPQLARTFKAQEIIGVTFTSIQNDFTDLVADDPVVIFRTPTTEDIHMVEHFAEEIEARLSHPGQALNFRQLLREAIDEFRIDRVKLSKGLGVSTIKIADWYDGHRKPDDAEQRRILQWLATQARFEVARSA